MTATPLALLLLALAPPAAAMLTQGSLLFSERHLYVASAGAAWLAATPAIATRGAARTAWLAILTLLVATSVLRTRDVLPAWRSDATLFHAMTVEAPRNVMGHVQWARTLALEGREEEAAAELDRAAELDSTRASVHEVRALLRYRHGDWPGVLEAANRARALDPEARAPRVLAATALVRMGRGGDASPLLEALRRESPDDPTLESLLGQARLRAGDPGGARPLLERAALTLEDDPDLDWALAAARDAAGDLAGSRAALARAVRTDPTFYAAWLRLAIADHRLADRAARDEAIARAAALPNARAEEIAVLRARFAREDSLTLRGGR